MSDNPGLNQGGKTRFLMDQYGLTNGFCEWCDQWEKLDPTGTHCANCLGKMGRLIERVRKKTLRDALDYFCNAGSVSDGSPLTSRDCDFIDWAEAQINKKTPPGTVPGGADRKE